MVSSISPQYQDLFQACLSFPKQLSQTDGLYCRPEVKLGDKSFNFNPDKFPGTRKIPSNYRREKGNLLERGLLTSGNHLVGSVASGDSTGAHNGIIFSTALSSSPCSRTVPWSRHVFSPPKIQQLDGVVNFISEKGLDI